MLRIMQVTEAQWAFIWGKVMPMSRKSAEWIGTDNLILNDEEGPILLTIGRVEVLTDPPLKVKRYLDKMEHSPEYDLAGGYSPKETE
jgi:hypothetical protein